VNVSRLPLEVPGLPERVSEVTDSTSSHIRLVSDSLPDSHPMCTSGFLPEQQSAPCFSESTPQNFSQYAHLPLAQQVLQMLMSAANPQMGLQGVAKLLTDVMQVEGCVVCDRTPQISTQVQAIWLNKPRLIQKQAEILNLCQQWLLESGIDRPSTPNVADPSEFLPLCPPIQEAWKALGTSAIALTTGQAGQVHGGIFLVGRKVKLTDWQSESLQLALPAIAYGISQATLQAEKNRRANYQTFAHELSLAIRNSADLAEVSQLALGGIGQLLQASRTSILRLKFWDPRQMVRSPERIPKARVIIDSTWSSPAYLESQQTTSELANPETEQVDPLAVESASKTIAHHSFWVADCQICQYAMRHNTQSITLPDREAMQVLLSKTGAVAPMFDPQEMSSLLMVPLESKNKLLGFLSIQATQARIWRAEEVELAEMVAAQLSSAIIQTETLRQVESLVEERTSQLQQSLELQAKLYEITRKQIEKLREMNQRMDEFLSTLSHELRTPLTSMMLAIRMLREATLSPERRLQYLNILEQQCAQETSLINDLLALQELESKQVAMQMQTVNLKQVVEQLCHGFDQRWSAKGLTLQVELPKSLPTLCTDASSLNRILLELLTNAGKYSDPNYTIRLQVKTNADRQVAIILANVGAGISEEELPYIFDKFRRCQGVTQNAVPGTGLGLALVKSLIQHLNGSISATSTAIADSSSYETVFTILLPQQLDDTKS
jgi:signal transduction histidine kinase